MILMYVIQNKQVEVEVEVEVNIYLSPFVDININPQNIHGTSD